MPLECKLNTCFYSFLSHLQVDKKARLGWSWVFFFLQFCPSLINFQQVQLVNYFSWGAGAGKAGKRGGEALLRKPKCSGVFHNG